MSVRLTKTRRVVCAVFLFLLLGIAALTGVGNASEHINGVSVAHAACDSPHPPPGIDCLATPTPTATPGNH